MSHWIWIPIAAVVGFGGVGTANAEIYRCLHEQTVVFADHPCGENAESYAFEHSISVIEAPQGLDEIARENQAFLLQREQRKQALLAAARERQQRIEEQRVLSEQTAPEVQYVAVYPRRFDQPYRRPDNGDDQEPPPAEPSEPVTDRARILANRPVYGRNVRP